MPLLERPPRTDQKKRDEVDRLGREAVEEDLELEALIEPSVKAVAEDFEQAVEEFERRLSEKDSEIADLRRRVERGRRMKPFKPEAAAIAANISL
jgi:hypothetical protein